MPALTLANPRRNRGRVRPSRGFTLLETMLAMVIIGVGILSMMTLVGSLTDENSTSNRMTTAMLLATNIQETMAGLSFNDPAYGNTYYGAESGETLASFDDLDDFDGQTFNPPIDATRTQIPSLSQYSQVVSVWPIYANQLASNTNSASPDFPKTAYTGAARVQVRILYRRTTTTAWQEVYRTSWVRTAG